MSYTIDIYRREVAAGPEPARSYAAFVALFPHLIAGPIVRYSTIDGQLRKLTPRLTWRAAPRSGIFFLTCGLVKKLLIADTLAPHVDRLFARHDAPRRWSPAGRRRVGYSLQLYFDFSGYSDMAVGLALPARLPLPAELQLAVQGA